MLQLQFNEKNKIFINIQKNENIIFLNDKSVYDFISINSILSSIVENSNNIESFILINMSCSDVFCNNEFYFLNLNNKNEYSIFEKVLEKNNADFFQNKYFDLGINKNNVINTLEIINKNIDFSDKNRIIAIDISNISNIENLLKIIEKMNKKNITFILSANEITAELNIIAQHKLILGCIKKFANYKNNSYVYNNEMIYNNILENNTDNKIVGKKIEFLDHNQLLINFEKYNLNKQMISF